MSSVALPAPGRPAGRISKRALGTVGIVVLTLVWLIPVVLVIFAALKPERAIYARNGLITPPTHPDWSNFTTAWRDGNLATYMRNSLLITIIKVPLGVLIEALAAYALTRLRFRWSTAVFLFFLIGMVLPVQAALIPLHTVLVNWGLIDSYAGLIPIYLGFGVPFGILILRGFFMTIPRSLDEAATIDGAGPLRVFWSVVLPLSWPAIASLFIFDSLFTWNEFIFAQLFITTEDKRPMQAGLMAFTGEHTQSVALLNAGILISIVPVVLVYVIFQRRFVSGLAGAVRG